MEVEGGDGKPRRIGDLAAEVSRQFVEVQLEQLVKLVFDSVFRETGRVTEAHVMEYLLLGEWALRVSRERYRREQRQAISEVEKGHVEFPLAPVAELMQNAHFELIYKLLLRQTTRQKNRKKLFRINLFHAALALFRQYLAVVSDLSMSIRSGDRKNANVLMANMFRHDIARLLRNGFQLTSHPTLLSLLITITHSFFSLLSFYSDGKILTIQTSKLLSRRKKDRKDSEDQREMVEFIEQDQMDQDGSGQYDVEEKEKRRVNAARQAKIQENKFQERKYNEKSQFAIIAEYGVIRKYLTFLEGERFATNQKALNEAIFFYIGQIKRLLGGEWLFFQAPTLVCFQRILSHYDFCKAHIDYARLIQGICTSFIRLLTRNPLALVESLFPYSNLSLKEKILKNYAEGEYGQGPREENMFTDE